MKTPTNNISKALIIGSILIMAGGTFSTVNAGGTPPHSYPSQKKINLQGASIDTIRMHILDSCVIREWGKTESSTDRYADRCACFAQNVTRSMTEEELDSFRQLGIFNSSSRKKAESIQAQCKL